MFLLGVAKNLTNDEMVKQMQDQVISMQDKQMSFLNDTIGNTNDSIIIFLTALGVVSASVITWIGFMQRNAKKKMDEAEEKMKVASEQLAHAESLIRKAEDDMSNLEKYRTEVGKYKGETEERFRDINFMIDNRMEDLKQIEDKTNNLWLRHQAAEKIARLGQMVEYIETTMEFHTDHDGTGKEGPDYSEFKDRNEEIKGEYRVLQSNLDVTILEDIPVFDDHCSRILQKSFNLLGEIQDISFQFYNTQKGL